MNRCLYLFTLTLLNLLTTSICNFTMTSEFSFKKLTRSYRIYNSKPASYSDESEKDILGNIPFRGMDQHFSVFFTSSVSLISSRDRTVYTLSLGSGIEAARNISPYIWRSSPDRGSPITELRTTFGVFEKVETDSSREESSHYITPKTKHRL